MMYGSGYVPATPICVKALMVYRVRPVNTTNLDLHSKVVMYRHQSQVDGCAPKHA